MNGDTGECLDRVRVEEPVPLPTGCHHELTAPAWRDAELLVPSRAALYACDLTRRSWRLVAHHPWMTDLHAVAPSGDGGVWLVSTGIDAILRLDAAGAVQERIDLGEPVPGKDFRTLSYDALKPHSLHPNFIAEWGGGLWVTCLEARQCRDLRSGRVLSFPEGGPHDGCLRDGLVWFTTVTGHVIAVDPQSTERVEVYDLNELTSSHRMLGWCRGIEVVGDRVWVGMTQLRRSRPREWLRPVLRGEKGRKAPTRLVEFSRSERRLVRETVIGGGTGTTVFGIRAVSPGE